MRELLSLTRFEKGCITFTILIFVAMIAGAIYFGLTMRQANLIEENEQLRAEQERAKLELMEENERLRDREILRQMYANQKLQMFGKDDLQIKLFAQEILKTISKFFISYGITMLQKLVECEVMAALSGNFTILLPLKFYVKSIWQI